MKVHLLRHQLRETTWRAILDAAEDVAAAEGASRASLQAIAERAGVAVGTIYNHFHDKEELLQELFTRRREELYAQIDRTTKAHGREPFARQLEAFVAAVFEYFDSRRAFLRLSVESEKPAVVKGKDGRRRPAMRQLQDRAERIVRIGLREKCLRGGNASLLAAVLVSIVRGVLVLLAHGDQPFVSETQRVVSLFLHGAGR
ncbi:MAG TPA: TetR/AcrR family transcriptional regulator [Polyangiaceae bacterium]|nr:TetR/AcrR family transcriptional regulator [Polyangiaceae bacterium]